MREPSERADGLYDELLPKLAGTAALTLRERAALDFAEGLAAARPSVDAALMARLRAVFTDAEIVELGFAAGGFLMGAASTAPSTSLPLAPATTRCWPMRAGECRTTILSLTERTG